MASLVTGPLTADHRSFCNLETGGRGRDPAYSVDGFVGLSNSNLNPDPIKRLLFQHAPVFLAWIYRCFRFGGLPQVLYMILGDCP